MFFFCCLLVSIVVKDIDECTVSNPCGPNSVCVNLVGSYFCRCLNGYEHVPGNSNQCQGTIMIGIILECHALKPHSLWNLNPLKWNPESKRLWYSKGRKWVLPNSRLEMYNVVAHFLHFGEMKMAVIYVWHEWIRWFLHFAKSDSNQSSKMGTTVIHKIECNGVGVPATPALWKLTKILSTFQFPEAMLFI